MPQHTRPNPVVASGSCRLCGQYVELHESDAADYLAHPERGMAHADCLRFGPRPQPDTVCPMCGELGTVYATRDTWRCSECGAGGS